MKLAAMVRGDTKPANWPIELIAAIPAAAEAPDRKEPGIVQKTVAALTPNPTSVRHAIVK